MPLEPITREENFLARIAGDGGKELEPITRTEHFLQRIIEAGRKTTPESVVDATGDMTAEQKAQTRQNIGAGEPLTPEQIAEGAGAWLEDNLVTPSTPPIDSSLSVANAAADAKAVGDKVGELNSALSVAVDSSPSSWESVALTLQNGYYHKDNGAFYSANDRRTAKLAVSVGDKYKLSTYTRSTVIPGIVFFNSNDTLVSTLLDGTGTGQVITDYEFTVPSGVASMAVQSSDSAQAVPVLSKYKSGTATFKAYTKSEADARFEPIKKYGLKWEIANADDLGSRCFDSVGLTASIGIGSGSGQSDFDNIYPWSEIKRCNIKQNVNGAKIVTFEGETGFALDGSNGDVFVRIPKFYYEHYSDNGFEYVTISSEGDKLHPVFVENGLVLDEIFVGAFEGYINNDKLHSVGNVIPTSNETGATFLSAATANGIGYTLYDMRTSDALWALMAVEFGCRNTNRIIGYGYADFLQPTSGTWGVDCDMAGTTNVFSASKSITQVRINLMLIGSNCTICKGSQANVIASRKITSITSDANHWYITFDGDPITLDTTCFIGSAGCTTNFCESAPTGAMSYHTGRANWVNGSNTKNPIRYRWIENVVGSLWAIFPDITFNDLQMYQCSDITKYNVGAIDNGYVPIGDLLPQQESNGNKSDVTGANFWVTKMFNPYFGKGITFGKEWDTSLTSDKAFGAFYYLMTGRKIVANGGGFDHLYRCNMLTNRAWLATSDAWYLYGSRLIYKNI